MSINGIQTQSRSGAALLEVMVALTILALAAASVVGFVNNSVRAIGHTREAELEMRRASALLDAVALWPREDLDRHIGERRQGAWEMRIARPTTTLYLVVLSDSLGIRELLRTAIYRPQLPSTAVMHVAR